MTTPTVLITGFEPFDGMDENLSGTMIRHLESVNFEIPHVDLQFAVLPVSYEKADVSILELLAELRPHTVLAFGIGRSEPLITIERIALNIDDAECCDNCGESRNGTLIETDGPAAYFSNVPLVSIQDALRKAAIPSAISNHAGAFLCNHLLYRLLHASETSGCPASACFLHLPRIPWDRNIADQLEHAVRLIAETATGIRSY
ncbi:MAG: hypothetical protein R3F19_05395 [Verrucomicrobiales bacterium]